MKEAAFLLQLLRLPGIGPVGLRQILARMSSSGLSIDKLLKLGSEKSAIELQLSVEQVLPLFDPEADPEGDLQQCLDLGIQIILSTDHLYPRQLSSLLGRNAPPMLFCKGNIELLQSPALGISGSRSANEYSLAKVSKLCEAVGSEGWVIVSGGARGADEAAHLAAIRSAPGTIIVLPTGVLKSNFRRELANHLEERKALLVSEFIPEQGWTTGCAMQRNRILAALSRAVVLVEPRLQGGTSGTGRIAQKLGVPLHILETAYGSVRSARQFIDNGAKQISAEDIIPKEISLMLQKDWEASKKERKNKKGELSF